MLPKITIILPTHNNWSDTQKCLNSIEKLTYQKNKIQVVVVDNKSTDDTLEQLKTNYPWVKTIKLPKNLGFSQAINKGIKIVQSKYILISNNDIIYDKIYLKQLVNFLEKHPKIGIIGGKIYYLTPGINKDKKIAFCGAHFNFYTGLLSLGKTPNKISLTDWVPGCNMLIRKKVFNKIGLFDKKYFFYFEDFDFCQKARKAGYGVYYFPKACIWHHEGKTINQEPWQKKSDLFYAGKTRFLFKHATKTQLVSALFFQFFIGLPYHLLFLGHQNFTSAFKALKNNLKNS